jgi:hypothetical protein
VVYISSDAVYRDAKAPLTEQSCAEPASLHGAMHLTRELMLRSVVSAPLAVLRPSLLYGAADPHNGYGPNRFRRLAAAGQDIVLFGEGEERRDHVLIEDVAEVIWRVLAHRSRGILNVATGKVWSFREIAERIAAMAAPAVAVRGSPRTGPVPHGGYRAFDAATCRAAFLISATSIWKKVCVELGCPGPATPMTRALEVVAQGYRSHGQADNRAGRSAEAGRLMICAKQPATASADVLTSCCTRAPGSGPAPGHRGRARHLCARS